MEADTDEFLEEPLIPDLPHFLKTIHRYPDDDTPRLIFADWLEEHGDADHAELIRLECRFAESGVVNNLEALRRLEQHPLRLSQTQRWGDILQQNGFHYYSLRGMNIQRGMLIHVPCHTSPEALRSTESRWPFVLDFALIPNQICKAAFFAHEALWRVGSLGCEGLGIRDDALAPLPDAEHYLALRLLDLSENTIGRQGMTAIARCPSLIHLRNLKLRGNQLGGLGLAALAESSYLRRLEYLHLGNNRIDDAGLIALSQSPVASEIRTLILHGNLIGDEGIIALANSPYFANLEHLHIGNNEIGIAGIEALARSPYLQQLYFLNAIPNPVDQHSEAVRLLHERLRGMTDLIAVGRDDELIID